MARPHRSPSTGPFDAAKGTFADVKSEDGVAELPNIANVAFRANEPVQVWFEKQQALALLSGSIDSFATAIDLDRLAAGGTDDWRPGPGYFDRIFSSAPSISGEGSTEGVLQHYGVYVPTAYRAGTPAPATFWMHWRGGKAHSAASVAPRIMRDLGEARGGFVFAPRGRGTSTWYLGKGMADFLEVWDESMGAFTVNPDRVYVAGHSMGGWASYLLSAVFPDRFAAGLPVAPPATQGAYVSPIDDKCDECFIQANNGDAKASHVYKLLDNVRHVPLAIFQGAADELVPLPQNVGMAKRLTELGYQHRFYVFPSYEHFSHPIIDEWSDGARYMDRFTRDPNPREVTYVRDMPFERATETGPDQRPANQTKGLSFDFDRAYWMSELTPRDMVAGRASFTGTTDGRPSQQTLTAPDVGGPASLGQTGPYVYTGLQQVIVPGAPLQPPANGFNATLTGASAVRLDLGRMALRTDQPLTAVVATDGALELRLAGPWTRVPTVLVEGAAVVATLADGVLRIPIASAGINDIVIT